MKIIIYKESPCIIINNLEVKIYDVMYTRTFFQILFKNEIIIIEKYKDETKWTKYDNNDFNIIKKYYK